MNLEQEYIARGALPPGRGHTDYEAWNAGVISRSGVVDLPRAPAHAPRCLIGELQEMLISRCQHRELKSMFSYPLIKLSEVGSTAKGTSIPGSDVDIVAVFDVGNKPLTKRLQQQLLSELGTVLQLISDNCLGDRRIELVSSSDYVHHGIYRSGSDRIPFDILVASGADHDLGGRINSAGLGPQRVAFVKRQPKAMLEGIRRLKANVLEWGLPDHSFTSYLLEVLTIAAVQTQTRPCNAPDPIETVEEQTIVLAAGLLPFDGQSATEVHWVREANGMRSYLVRGRNLIVVDPADASNNLAGIAIEPFVRYCQRLVSSHEERVDFESWTPEEIGWTGDPDCWDIAAGCSSD